MSKRKPKKRIAKKLLKKQKRFLDPNRKLADISLEENSEVAGKLHLDDRKTAERIRSGYRRRIDYLSLTRTLT